MGSSLTGFGRLGLRLNLKSCQALRLSGLRMSMAKPFRSVMKVPDFMLDVAGIRCQARRIEDEVAARTRKTVREATYVLCYLLLTIY